MDEQAKERDLELVRLLLDGDEASFRELVHGYHASMIRVARLFVGSQAVAEEVVQEAWMGLLKGLARFEGRSSLKTWLYRIVVNRAKTRSLRERRSRPFSSLESEQDDMPMDPSRFKAGGGWASPLHPWNETSPEDELVRSEALAEVKTALVALPDPQQTVVRLRDVEGWSSREVCELLELSDVNQRVLLHRGRVKIRNAVDAAHKRRRTGPRGTLELGSTAGIGSRAQ